MSSGLVRVFTRDAVGGGAAARRAIVRGSLRAQLAGAVLQVG
jgi:hypothetical protein